MFQLLNEQQLEIAARKLCEFRAVNPNEQIWLMPPNGGFKCRTTQLEIVKKEIKAANEIQTAISFGYGTVNQ